MANGADSLFGPMLIGVTLNCLLYGVTVVQTFVYFQTYKSDARWIRMFVLYLLFCETLNTACDIGVVYEPLITRYATPEVFINVPIMLAADSAVTVMISTPVQLFIAWRVKIMSKSTILPAIISFFAIVSFIGGVTTSVFIAVLKKFALFDRFLGAIITWLASSAAADVVITGSLVYHLMRRRTGFAATDDLIHRIIRLTVHTGLITTVFALLDVILPAVFPTSSINFVFDFALSKLYSNSLLSTLNARAGWKASSSFRDNVLFGNGTTGDITARSRSQIEIISVDPETAGRPSSMFPMKVFDTRTGYHAEGSRSAITVSKKVAVEV